MAHVESTFDEGLQTAPRTRWISLAVLCAALFLEAMNLSSINVQIPALSESLHLTTETSEFVISAYLVTYAGFLLLGGRLADLFGRRSLFIGGVALFGIASLVGGFAWNSELLIAARAAQGVGAALTAPAALSIITTTFREGPERNRALGIYSAMGASGFAIGAVLSGILTSLLNWRWGFFDYTIISAFVVLLTPLLVEKDHQEKAVKRDIDLAGALMITAGLLLLVYAVSMVHLVSLMQTLVLLAFAILLLISFVGVELKARAPMLPFSIFRSRSLSSANLVSLTFLAAFTGMLFISTLYLQKVLGYNAFQAGLVFVPMGIVAIVGSNVATRLIKKLGLKSTLLLGMFLITVGIGLTAFIEVNGTFWHVCIPSLLVGTGLSLAYPPMTIAALKDVRDEDQGLASGLITTGQQLGGALGLALVTVFNVAWTPVIKEIDPPVQLVHQALITGFRPALLLAAAFALLGLLVTFFGLKRDQVPQPTSQVASQAPLSEQSLR